MSITVLQKKITPVVGQQKYITWEVFQQKYLTREDGYKYEWLNGKVEKTKRYMDYTQLFIVKNLVAFFRQLLNDHKADGELLSEGDIFFLENHRRPDMFYMTDKQLAYTAHGQNQVPLFVIEIISNKDQINKVTHKMQNYRDAGVQVVWHLFPNYDEVHVYNGVNLTSMNVCTNNDICSANPVLPDFEISVNDIFKKPPMPE